MSVDYAMHERGPKWVHPGRWRLGVAHPTRSPAAYIGRSSHSALPHLWHPVAASVQCKSTARMFAESQAGALVWISCVCPRGASGRILTELEILISNLMTNPFEQGSAPAAHHEEVDDAEDKVFNLENELASLPEAGPERKQHLMEMVFQLKQSVDPVRDKLHWEHEDLPDVAAMKRGYEQLLQDWATLVRASAGISREDYRRYYHARLGDE